MNVFLASIYSICFPLFANGRPDLPKARSQLNFSQIQERAEEKKKITELKLYQGEVFFCLELEFVLLQ